MKKLNQKNYPKTKNKMTKDYYMYMGFKSKLIYDFSFESILYGCDFRYFFTDTKIAIDYVEITPFNKGCLIKVRIYKGYYNIYLGTKKISYCSTYISMVREIKNINQ